MTNLWVLIAIVMTFPVMQTNCHVGRTGVNDGLVPAPLLNDSDGIKLIHADANEFTSITWINRASDIHVINKIDGEWYYAGMESIEGKKIEAYLASLTAVRGNDFFEYLNRPADEKIIIEGTGLMKPVIISVQGPESNRYYIHSTHAPDISFISDSCGLYKQIFSNLKALWP